MLLHWQSFLLGIAISIGCLSYLSTQFNGLGHIPTAIELPGIALANLLDKVPVSIASSSLWPNALFERIEGLLDYYTCPRGHEYRVDMVSQEPLILRFRGFLPPGEATHLLKLSERDESSTSYVARWTENDPTRMYLEPDEDKVVACLEARISSVTGYPIHNLEAIQVVENSGERGTEDPTANVWPEWQPFDTTPSKRIARMVVALDIGSQSSWDIEFPQLKKIVSLQNNDALFWRNLLPNGTYDDRVIHKILTNEEVFSANVFIDEEFWRPAWWEVS